MHINQKRVIRRRQLPCNDSQARWLGSASDDSARRFESKVRKRLRSRRQGVWPEPSNGRTLHMSKKRGETKMTDVAVPTAKWEKLLKLNTEPTLDTIIDNEVQSIRSDKENRILTALAQPRPRSRTFTAKPCSVCQALREPNTNFTRVYASRGNIRYCRCSFCNNTWKDSDG